MKLLKAIAVCLSLISLLCCSGFSVSAARDQTEPADFSIASQLQPVRAGGGEGGGGSGGGGGGSAGTGGYSGDTGGYYPSRQRSRNPFSWLIGGAAFVLITFGTAILFRLRLFGRYRNARKLIRRLERNDSGWNYEELQAQVRRAYFLIQNAWNNLDMTPAKEVMSPALFENFQAKLYWMSCRQEQNILGEIRLLEATPVAANDNEDDSLDYIWFYITGSMVDYILNTETQMVVRGNTKPEKFGEYWQFIRNEQGNWVLNQILQKDQENLLPTNA